MTIESIVARLNMHKSDALYKKMGYHSKVNFEKKHSKLSMYVDGKVYVLGTEGNLFKGAAAVHSLV